MTLGEFFDLLTANPSVVLFYVIALPLTAFLSCIFAKHEGHLSPWKYVHSALIYLACIPGIFAITLNVYLFLFERQPIMETNLYTQVLPIITMGITLYFISQNVSLKTIPGFGKLSGLLMALMALFFLMWFMEKTRLLVFSYLPIQYVFIGIIALLVIVRLGTKRFLTKSSD